MNDDLKLSITLEDGKVVSGFINIEKKAEQSAKKIGSNFDDFTDSVSDKIKGIGVALAAAFTVGKVISFLKDSAREAAEAEKATNALGASLAQIGKFSSGAVAEFSAYAAQLQATTGIQDDLIKQNAALLVSIGNLSGNDLKRATKASLDLAQALQIDVGTAFDLLSKAAAGNTGALGRYGIKIDENIPKSQKFAATLGLIETRFAGLAETRLNTFEGALTNLSNAFGEIKESVGGFITDSPVLRTAINFISVELFRAAEAIGKFGQQGDVIGRFAIAFVEAGLFINEYLIKPLELGFNFLKLGLMSIKLVLDAIVVGVVGFSKLLVEAIVYPLRDVALGVASLVGVVNKSLGEDMRKATIGLSASLTQPLEAEMSQAKLIFNTTLADMTDEADSTFNSKIGGGVESFLTRFKAAMENAKASSKSFANSAGSDADNIANIYTHLTKTIKESLGNGISVAFQTVGKNLQAGVGLFDDFGGAILGIFGDILINVGNALILQGLAVEAFIEAITSLFPGSGLLAAAAGVGLVVFGSALKASVGKGGGSPAAAQGAGGGVSVAPGTATELNQQESFQEREEPGTAVSVVIQGDVLDSDESGSRIVDLINKAFDKKGVVISQGAFA